MQSRQMFFNKIAGQWDRRVQSQRLSQFLDSYVPKFGLKYGQKILDVGAGTGILIPFLLQEVGRSGYVVGIDYAEKMIDICKSKYGHLSNVRFEVRNVGQIDYSSGSFDAVTCFGLFPHLENRKEALSQINRVLKLGGRLVIAHSLSSAELAAHHQSSSAVVAQDSLPNSLEMKELLRTAGFGGISIKDEPECYLCLSDKVSV
jgi:demethylmenaquinone methyltransferase/2-methoxy-6-polyprenyl-1,4-benzoquinol methylase